MKSGISWEIECSLRAQPVNPTLRPLPSTRDLRSFKFGERALRAGLGVNAALARPQESEPLPSPPSFSSPNQSADPIFLMIANKRPPPERPLTEFADRYNKFRASPFFSGFRLFHCGAERAAQGQPPHATDRRTTTLTISR